MNHGPDVVTAGAVHEADLLQALNVPLGTVFPAYGQLILQVFTLADQCLIHNMVDIVLFFRFGYEIHSAIVGIEIEEDAAW